jgi:hypothetical protein
MMKSMYMVQVTALEEVNKDDYKEAAQTMKDILCDVFGETSKVLKMTKGKLLSSHTEVEVTCEESNVVGRAICEIDGESKVSLDKPKLSSLVKALAPWQVKVEKRSVLADELPRPQVKLEQQDAVENTPTQLET